MSHFMRRLTKRTSVYKPSPLGMAVSYVLLGIWTFVALFPIYWLIVTSFKLPIQVNQGPFYIPGVDFEPSLHAWDYILVGDLSNDTLRTYLNTAVVAPISALLALLFGAAAAYALVRFEFRPRLGVILSFIGCVLLAIAAVFFGVNWIIAIVASMAIFVILVATIGKRFRRSLGNNDIAFWMISQRMLPPVAVVIPIYVLFQRINLLDT